MPLPVRAEALLLSALSLASVTAEPDPAECDTDRLGTRGGDPEAGEAGEAGELRPVVGEDRPAPKVVLAAGVSSRLCSCTKAEVSSAFMRHTW